VVGFFKWSCGRKRIWKASKYDILFEKNFGEGITLRAGCCNGLEV